METLQLYKQQNSLAALATPDIFAYLYQSDYFLQLSVFAHFTAVYCALPFSQDMKIKKYTYCMYKCK